VNTESFYTGDNPIETKLPEFRPLSKSHLSRLGLAGDSRMGMVNKIEDLREDPPKIVIAEATANTGFVQNSFKYQRISKKVKYVMGLGIYIQLHHDMKYNKKVLKPSPIKFRNLYRPYEGQELDGKTLLVWRTGGIGDLCFIQPNLRYLKEKYPTCKIWFGCGPQYQAMVETWDCVDLVIDLPFPLRFLMQSDYHAIFEGVIERCHEAHTENAYNLFTRWLNLNLPEDRLYPINIPKQDKVEDAKKVLNEWGVEPGDFVVVQIRASSPIRTPRPDFWRKIINSLTGRGHKVVIVDGAHVKNSIDDFMRLLDRKEMVFNFAPHSVSLDYSIALTSLASLVVATDSAMIHIGVSVNVPVFGIYGPFPGKIRMSTYKNVDWIDCLAPCAPCFLHGSNPCPNNQDGHGQCYDQINIYQFLHRVEKLIGHKLPSEKPNDQDNDDCQKSYCNNEESDNSSEKTLGT